MAYTVSRVRHERLPEDSQALTYSRSVQALMFPHRNCVAGHGSTAAACGARAQLMEIAVAAGWAWAGEIPDTACGD